MLCDFLNDLNDLFDKYLKSSIDSESLVKIRKVKFTIESTLKIILK
jgi:hypothetical protein